jgi:hypothetical protein
MPEHVKIAMKDVVKAFFDAAMVEGRWVIGNKVKWQNW